MFYFLENLRKFNDNVAIIDYKREELVHKYTYNEIITIAQDVTILINKYRGNYETVGIFYDVRKTFSIPLILGILNSDCGFCFVKSWNDKCLQEIEFCFCSTTSGQFPKDFKELASIQILGQSMKLIQKPKLRDLNYKFAYTITTSGTTGAEKIVRVPHKCIVPNVIALQNIFQLSTNDIIYSSAPCTFDVFVVDLFLALISGGSLLVIEEKFKFSGKLARLLIDFGVTFLQITPTLFRRLELENIRAFLEPSTKLRYLVFGGECWCPAKIREWQDWSLRKRKRIFNIYGITEVSCWATIHEISEDDLKANNFPIGKPIDQETILKFEEVEEQQEILIGSASRICLLDDEDPRILESENPVFRKTGDLVAISSNGSITIVGRSNEVIKRFGIRTNLKKIEFQAQGFPNIEDAHCVAHGQKLILFYKLIKMMEKESDLKFKTKLMNYLRKNLEDHEIPDELFEVTEIPVTPHGKISKPKLLENFENSSRDREKCSPCEQFLREIEKFLGKILLIPENSESAKRTKSDIFTSFKFLGGSSISALQILTSLENEFFQTFPELLVILLDDQKTIYDAWKYLRDFKQISGTDKVNLRQIQKSRFKVHIKANYDLKKCIDASPTLISDSIISVGSHSHIVGNFTKELELISEIELGDRVESQVSCFNDSQGIVGCYDGFLYCFDFRNGEIIWKFNSNGMIKCRALIIGSNIVFGNYNSTDANLWCLDRPHPHLKWKMKLGTKGILVSPVKLKNEKFFVATLDGTCCVLTLEGSKLWERQLNSPIFSEPRLVPDRSQIIVAEVWNRVHCLNTDDGSEIWNLEVQGNIFSSFEFHQPIGREQEQLQIFFGCHDRNLYSIIYDLPRKSARILWKTELQSQIFSTPRKMAVGQEVFLIVFTTNGHLNLIDFNGIVQATEQLPGEVFSSPAISDNKIYIGCRNNYLYLIELSEIQ